MNTADASVGTLIGPKAIESLPSNGRGVLSLVELAPGVLATPAATGEAGKFSANGLPFEHELLHTRWVERQYGRKRAGVPAQFAGAALPAMTAFGSMENLASLAALEEVRTPTSSFAPEFGRYRARRWRSQRGPGPMKFTAPCMARCGTGRSKRITGLPMPMA
jgi:hypothetical protein